MDIVKNEQSQKAKKGLEKSDFYELFLDEIQDIFWAEQHLVKALPNMIKAANSPTLKAGIENHLKETENHVNRLKEVFSLLGEEPKAKTCEAMKGLLEEAEELISDTKDMDPSVIDAAIIMASQKVEHYEIATYGSLTSIANSLDQKEIGDLLHQNLTEEKKANDLLSQVAEKEVNVKAAKA